jgi:hypothetical protein
MSNQKFFLTLALICLILYVISVFIFKTNNEGFDPTPTNMNSVCAPAGPWWLTTAPKQVISLITGVRFPIIAVRANDAINSPFQVPFMNSGSTEASGCIAIDSNGTYTTTVCNSSNIQQLWTIKPIMNETDFRNVLKMNTNKFSTGIERDYSDPSIALPLPQGVSYGFFMVVSQSNPSLVLASNGGNLTVQTIGVFTSQFWDITKDQGQADIAVYDTNDITQFSKSYTNSNGNIAMDRNVGINPLMPLNVQAGNIYQTTGLGANAGPNKQTDKKNDKSTINFNVNLTADTLSSLFTNSGTSGSSGTSTTNPDGSVKDSFTNGSEDCPACPSIVTDYISKNNIPCYGCSL